PNPYESFEPEGNPTEKVIKGLPKGNYSINISNGAECNAYIYNFEITGDAECPETDKDSDNDGILDVDEQESCDNQQITGLWKDNNGVVVDDISKKSREVNAEIDNGIKVKATLITVNNNYEFETQAGGFETLPNHTYTGGKAPLKKNFTNNEEFKIEFFNEQGQPIRVANPYIYIDQLGQKGATAKLTLLDGLTWSKVEGINDFNVTPTTVAGTEFGVDGSPRAKGVLKVEGFVHTIRIATKLIVGNPADYNDYDSVWMIFSACPPSDTDNDGLPNYLDLDSDNDGCPDALEANATLSHSDLNTNGSIKGDVSANGVPQGKQAQSAGTAQDAGQQAVACDPCDATKNTSLIDSDGDGVGDVCDLDDDNDGILDTEEMFTCDATQGIADDDFPTGHSNERVFDFENAPLNAWSGIDKIGTLNTAHRDDPSRSVAVNKLIAAGKIEDDNGNKVLNFNHFKRQDGAVGTADPVCEATDILLFNMTRIMVVVRELQMNMVHLWGIM
ncbi:MAG: hypothetical protein CSA94_02010, partial [Bacteroidetes bacterium]